MILRCVFFAFLIPIFAEGLPRVAKKPLFHRGFALDGRFFSSFEAGEMTKNRETDTLTRSRLDLNQKQGRDKHRQKSTGLSAVPL